MENPFESPREVSESKPIDGPISSVGLIEQVRILSILLYVQAGLEILMGVYYAFSATLFLFMPHHEGMFPQNGPIGTEEFVLIICAAMLAIGILIVATAGLRIYAAYRAYQFRGRVMGIVSLIFGCITILTCYCFPTSLALLVYGLIVYNNQDVKSAFTLGEQGTPAAQILATAAHYRRQTYMQ